MPENPADDVTLEASRSLEQASAALAGMAPPLMAAAQAQQAAAAAQQAAAQRQPLPLSQPAYVYQPQTAQQAAQQQAQQRQYPAGGTPAWTQPPAPTARQQAQQQAAAAGPTPGDLALARARATPIPPQAAGPAAPGGGMERFDSSLRSAAASLLIMRAAVSQTAGTLLEFGAKASPTHAATLTGSFDLLSARIGTFLLPAMEEMSRAAQTVAHNLPDASRPRGFLGGASLQDVGRPSLLSLVGLINRFSGEEPTKLSYKNLPQPQITSAEEYADRITRRGLSTGGVEADLLKLQLEALKDIKGLLQHGPGGQAAAPPSDSFR